MAQRTRALCALGSAAFGLAFATSGLAADPPALTQQDYFEIQQLNNRYVYAVDECTNSGYDYADLYTADGSFAVSQAWGDAGAVVAQGREALARAAGGGKDGCVPRQPTSPVFGIHHISTNLVITPTATGAYGRSMLLASGVGHDPTAIEWQGGYEDAYVKTAQGWRIQSRVHVWIGMETSVQYKTMVAAGIRFSTRTPAASSTEPKAP
jgi:hypothetical protein